MISKNLNKKKGCVDKPISFAQFKKKNIKILPSLVSIRMIFFLWYIHDVRAVKKFVFQEITSTSIHFSATVFTDKTNLKKKNKKNIVNQI